MDEDIKLSNDTLIRSYRINNPRCRYCEHCEFYVNYNSAVKYWCNLKFEYVTGLFGHFCKFYNYDMRKLQLRDLIK